MLIGEVAKRTGLSRDTIRFYEKKKLINVKRGTSEWNNYKNYDDDVLERLLLITKCKGFGFTLNEIGEILELTDAQQANCAVMSDKIKKKLSEIEMNIRKLEQMKDLIQGKFNVSAKSCGANAGKEINCRELVNRL